MLLPELFRRSALSVCLLLSCAIYSQNLSLGLNACYNFNGNLIDAVNGLNGGYPHSTLQISTGHTGQANTAIHPVSTPVQVFALPDSPLLKPANAISISCWVNFATLGSLERLVFTRNTLSASGNSNVEAYQLALAIVNGGMHFMASKSGPAGTNSVVGTSTVINHAWYHVVCTMDNTNLKIYVNGALDGTATSTFSGFDYTTGKVMLGMADNSSYLSPMDGDLDNMRFYDRTLSAAEVSLLYTQDPSCFAAPQPPGCNSNTYYSITSGAIYAFHYGGVPSPTLVPIVLPAGATGLAVGPRFGFTVPNPTFWTVAGNTLWYFDGNQFVNTTHNAGTGVASLGGSANYIYGQDNATGNVYKYNGSGAASFVATCSNTTSYDRDLVGDDLDNFYLFFQTTGTYHVNKYNSSGVLLCQPGTIPFGGVEQSGFAMEGNNLAFVTNTAAFGSFNSNAYTNGTLTLPYGGLNLTSTQFTQALVNDMASCPYSTTLAASVSAGQYSVLSCASPAVQFTVNMNLNDYFYYTFTWSGPGAVQQYINTATVQTAGVYHVNVYNSCTGRSTSTNYTVASGNAPLSLSVSPASATVCASAPAVTLTADGALSYSWQPSGSVAPNTGSLVVVTPSATAIYTVSGVTSATCHGSATVGIYVLPDPVIIPVATSTLICQGSSVGISVSGASGYTWQPGNLGGSANSFTPVTNTVYTISGTSANGCVGSGSVAVSVTVCNTSTPTAIGVNQNDEGGFKVYPNPAHDYIHVDAPAAPGLVDAELCNAYGIAVLKLPLMSLPAGIDLSALPEGIYMLRLSSGGHTTVKKIIRE